MLVRANDDHEDYGPVTRVKRAVLYVVYAIERNEKNEDLQYCVYPAGKHLGDYDEPDPLFFPAEWFSVVADDISQDWTQKTITVPDGTSKRYLSFREWFEGDFHMRAHDWDLNGDDYAIIRKYKEKYEAIYAKYLPN